MKSSNFKSEILFHHKQIIEEIADHGIFDRETIWETKDTQPKEFSEGELININDESGFDKKDDDVPEVMLANNFNIKETLKYFVTFESMKNKMLEINWNLERSMTICQCTEKVFSPYHKL